MTQSHSYIVNFISLSIGRGTDDLDFFVSKFYFYFYWMREEGIGFAIASDSDNIVNITINNVLLIREVDCPSAPS